MARKQTNGHSNDDPTKPWQFKKGHKPLEGVGRPKGMPNHETRVLKDAVMVAARLTGDVDLIPARTIKADKARLKAIAALYEESEEDAAKRAGLVGYLCYLARNHPRTYASLLARVLPLQIKMEAHETVIYRSTQAGRSSAMAVMIDTGRRRRMRMPGDVAVVRKAASWRTIGGYDGQ